MFIKSVPSYQEKWESYKERCLPVLPIFVAIGVIACLAATLSVLAQKNITLGPFNSLSKIPNSLNMALFTLGVIDIIVCLCLYSLFSTEKIGALSVEESRDDIFTAFNNRNLKKVRELLKEDLERAVELNQEKKCIVEICFEKLKESHDRFFEEVLIACARNGFDPDDCPLTVNGVDTNFLEATLDMHHPARLIGSLVEKNGLEVIQFRKPMEAVEENGIEITPSLKGFVGLKTWINTHSLTNANRELFLSWTQID